MAMDGVSTMQDEVGAVDDRLSLNPNQYDFTKDWEDGQEYEITLKVKQISAGEFQVIEATSSEDAEHPKEPGTEQQPEGEATENDKEMGGAPANPAVRRMMSGSKY